MSTGSNFKRLHNAVFASAFKSRIRNMQSIGRTLRLSNEKNEAILYDIADDMKHKNKMNHTLRHFTERLKLYVEEDHSFTIHEFKL
jgi:superfamily II DNA or RNA helicase